MKRYLEDIRKRTERTLLYTFNLAHQELANLLIRPLIRGRAAELSHDKVRRVLILRNDAIGDAVVTLPFIEGLAKKVEHVDVWCSKYNSFVFKDIKAKNVNVIVKRVETPAGAWQWGVEYLSAFFHYLIKQKKQTTYAYDLVIDGVGNPRLAAQAKGKIIVGPNKGLASIYYTNFLRYSFALSAVKEKKHLLDCYEELAKMAGIKVKAKDHCETNEKYEGCLVLVSSKQFRQLSAPQWETIIKQCATYGKVFVVDDPSENMANQLKARKAMQQKNIVFLKPMPLPKLREYAQKIGCVIALDGGAEHYLQKNTHTLTIYTVGIMEQWMPRMKIKTHVKIPITSKTYGEYFAGRIGSCIKAIGRVSLDCRITCYEVGCSEKPCITKLNKVVLQNIVKMFLDEVKKQGE